MRMWVTTAMCRARFKRRSPPRFIRWRTVFPEEAGIGFTPARLANAASDRTRPGCDQAAGPPPVASGMAALMSPDLRERRPGQWRWRESNLSCAVWKRCCEALTCGDVGVVAAVRGLVDVSASGRPAHEALPGVHLVFSLVKRWVMGTLHGSISPEHMPAYFDEWVFRFNRRHSRSRGLLFRRLLQQAVEGDALTYSDLRKAGRTRPPP